MTFYSLYIYSFILFVINNKHLFELNTDIHKYNTRNKNNLHLSNVNLTKVEKGPYIASIRALNHLPQTIKALDYNLQKFKNALKKFFYQHPFYSAEEYLEYKEESIGVLFE